MAKNLININSSEVVKFTAILEKMHKSDLPVAVRLALNQTAFDMKTKTLPKEFKKDFTIRRPKFLKSHSAFNKSPNTFDIRKMESQAGVYGGRRNDLAGKRLELQEIGGTISNRSIPYSDGNKSPVRVGQNASSKQRAIYYYTKFKNMSEGVLNSQRGKSVKNRARNQIIKTKKALMLVTKKGKWETLYLEERTARIDKSPFVEPAGVAASKGLPGNFIKEAKKRISKRKI